jgi:hypothetical protein
LKCIPLFHLKMLITPYCITDPPTYQKNRENFRFLQSYPNIITLRQEQYHNVTFRYYYYHYCFIAYSARERPMYIHCLSKSLTSADTEDGLWAHALDTNWHQPDDNSNVGQNKRLSHVKFIAPRWIYSILRGITTQLIVKRGFVWHDSMAHDNASRNLSPVP